MDLSGPNAQVHSPQYLDVAGGIQARMRPFEHLRRALEPEDAERVDEMRTLVRAKFEMDAHYTLQKTLRAWLYLHVPTSIALIGLLIAHLFAVFYY